MSLLGKTWNIVNTDRKQSLLEKLCNNRGLTDAEERAEFFALHYDTERFDPYLLKDLEKAVDRVLEAITKKQRIMIYGDYDVDGISGTAVMFHALSYLGAQVSYRLPHRIHDGYGLNTKCIDECLESKVSLLVTVDCGSSNAKEIAYAKKKKLDVIITDHHTIPEKGPKGAYAFINPQQKTCSYPFKGLSGSAIAYKFASAIIQKKLPNEDTDKIVTQLLELASLGIVADCVPLRSENRFLLKEGIRALRATHHAGLQSLFQKASINPAEINTTTIGYLIAPRLNAAGRIASPYHSIGLLLGKTEEADILEELNRKRQKMVADFLLEAENQIADDISNDEKGLVVFHHEWHIGVVGLIAGKLTEKYHRPAIALQKQDDTYIASARSIPSFDIMEPLHALNHYFDKYGGHKQAAGFSLPENHLLAFIEEFKAFCKKNIEPKSVVPTLNIDCEITSEDMTLTTTEEIRQFAPFGMANKEPLFIFQGACLHDIKAVGTDGNHLKCTVKTEDTSISGIAFRFGKFASDLHEGVKVDLACYFQKNEWKGNVNLQLQIVDITVHS